MNPTGLSVKVDSFNGGYSVQIRRGLLSESGSIISEAFGQRTIAVVSDQTVFDLYGAQLTESIRNAGLACCSHVFPAGESSKNFSTLERIVTFLAANQITRSDLLLALGGGVVGDLSGFAASIYNRGIRVIQMPTTLLAAVDSSVGGKTGIDLPQGKNLAGTFWQPSLVLCDPEVLKSLPAARFSEGMAEVIKSGFLADADLLALLESDQAGRSIEEIIARAVQIKADFVMRDPLDNGDRQLLNFGHTFGHAIERRSDFGISHGAAVAIGMMMACRASVRLGFAQPAVLERMTSLLQRYDLPIHFDYPADELAKYALSDKKRRSAELKFVLVHKEGDCFLYPVPIDRIGEIFHLGAA